MCMERNTTLSLVRDDGSDSKESAYAAHQPPCALYCRRLRARQPHAGRFSRGCTRCASAMFQTSSTSRSAEMTHACGGTASGPQRVRDGERGQVRFSTAATTVTYVEVVALELVGEAGEHHDAVVDLVLLVARVLHKPLLDGRRRRRCSVHVVPLARLRIDPVGLRCGENEGVQRCEHEKTGRLCVAQRTLPGPPPGPATAAPRPTVAGTGARARACREARERWCAWAESRPWRAARPATACWGTRPGPSRA